MACMEWRNMNYTYRQLLDQIEKNQNARQSLSQIRALLKEDKSHQQFMESLKDREQLLFDCLHHEDAKTRKNVSLLLGDIAGDISLNTTDILNATTYMERLFEAFEQEQQLFVRSAYLIALKNYDFRPYIDRLKEHLEKLSAMQPEESDRKHITDEIRAIEDMLMMAEGPKLHRFTGEHVKSNLILTTNRRHVDDVVEQIKEIDDINPDKIRTFSAGVMVQTDCIEELLQIRTYDEMLFQVPGMTVIPMDVKEAAAAIASSKLLAFLEDRHEAQTEDQPFIFRVELKSRMDLGSKSTFVKKFSYELERLTNRKLINHKTGYEFEIRLIETKQETFNCLVRLYTLKDQRFAYRKESTALSIRPVNAALLVALAKDYMVADANVLDPFCGVATMLIERQKVVKARSSYGIDISEEAIEKAKINTQAAGQIIHYIHRNCLEFTHEYLFDEIFTDLPFVTNHKTKDEIEEIYAGFFRWAKGVLTGNGRMILYTHDRDLIRHYAETEGYKILAHIPILEKAGTDLYILQVL